MHLLLRSQFTQSFNETKLTHHKHNLIESGHFLVRRYVKISNLTFLNISKMHTEPHNLRLMICLS